MTVQESLNALSLASADITSALAEQDQTINGLAEAGNAIRAIAPGIKKIVAATPQWYKRPSLFTTTKTTVTIPADTQVNINGQGFISSSDTTLDVSTAGTASARAGKDVYIYACVPTEEGADPVFVLSLNSTVPSGYDADTSRKIGGFHCLCADVGTISGHSFSGYVAGDVIGLSAWDLLHRAKSDNAGMVWVEGLGIWVDIYLPSYDGTKLTSAYGANIADGSSSPAFSGSLFAEYAGKCGKKLISYEEFCVVAKGSNEETNINGSADPTTTGGHVDTAGRRMISNYGVEDLCGVLWQWGRDLFESYNCASVKWMTTGNSTTYTEGSMRMYLDGYSWRKESVYASSIDSQSYGSCLGLLRRVRLGAFWGNGSLCGSRSAFCGLFSANAWFGDSGRLVSEPRAVCL